MKKITRQQYGRYVQGEPPQSSSSTQNWGEEWELDMKQERACVLQSIAEHSRADGRWTRASKGGCLSWLLLMSYRHCPCRASAVAVSWESTREGALKSVLGSPSSSTSHKDAWSHLPCLAMGSRQSDSTAVYPTLPEQMCLKAQFSLF